MSFSPAIQSYLSDIVYTAFDVLVPPEDDEFDHFLCRLEGGFGWQSEFKPFRWNSTTTFIYPCFFPRKLSFAVYYKNRLYSTTPLNFWVRKGDNLSFPRESRDAYLRSLVFFPD